MTEVGRWITRDTDEGESQSPQTLNKYVYTENNPVNSSDDNGKWARQVIFPHGKKDDSPLLKDILRVDAQWAYEHRRLNVFSKAYWFIGIVGKGCSWDFKLALDGWGSRRHGNMHFMTFRSNPRSRHFKKISPERFGNIHFGYVGRAIGYSLRALLRGSSIFDKISHKRWTNTKNEYLDQNDIKYGYRLYRCLGRRNPRNGLNLYAQQNLY